MAVDPTRADLARFLDEDPGGPIVMLNLLRFAPEGRASYAEYTRRARQILHKYGLNWSTPATALLPWSLRKDKRGTRCCSSATPAGKHSSVWLRTPNISRSQSSALRL